MKNEGLENKWSKNEGTPFIYTCKKKDFEKYKEYVIHEIPYSSLPDHHELPPGELCERVLYGIAQGYSREAYEHKFDDGAGKLFENAKFTHLHKVAQDFPHAFDDEVAFTSKLRPSEIPVEKRIPVQTVLLDKDFQKLQAISRVHIEITATAYRGSSDDYSYILRNSSGIDAIHDLAEEKQKDLEAYKEACRSGIASEPKYSRRILDFQKQDKGVWKDVNYLPYTFGEGKLSETNFLSHMLGKRGFDVLDGLQLYEKYTSDENSKTNKLSDTLTSILSQETTTLPPYPSVEESLKKWDELMKSPIPYGKGENARPEPDLLSGAKLGDKGYREACVKAFSKYADIGGSDNAVDHYSKMVRRLAETGRSVRQIKSLGVVDGQLEVFMDTPAAKKEFKQAHTRYLNHQR